MRKQVLPIIAVLFFACGDSSMTGPYTDADYSWHKPVLRIVNKGTSDLRPLEDIRIHSSVSDYQQYENLLDNDLFIDQSIDIEIIPLISEDFRLDNDEIFVTVIRKKLSLAESDLIAITTGKALQLTYGLYELWVFDEAFRLYDSYNSSDYSSYGNDE